MSKSTLKPTLRKNFAENVRSFRTQLGISQEGLAELAGFHRTYVSQVERCVANVTIDNIEKLAHALNIRPAALLELPTIRD
ncbi:helix-turn-helix transcriptional regulator [Collimonas sp. H4R21]|uniref:Helix-turn-helix transcriptional regulator n=1 Tax=Collimonas rhizosphaerae TaxID=3126357 RepID=A0ABU9Q3M3_9BURK